MQAADLAAVDLVRVNDGGGDKQVLMALRVGQRVFVAEAEAPAAEQRGARDTSRAQRIRARIDGLLVLLRLRVLPVARKVAVDVPDQGALLTAVTVGTPGWRQW